MLYGLSLYVLSEHIWGEYTGLVEWWYADAFITSGVGAHIKLAIYCIEALGPARGLFIKPYESKFVQAPGVSEEAAR